MKFWQGCDPCQFDGERVRWCHAWAFVDSLRGKNLKLLFWFCRVSACYLFMNEYAQSCRRMAPKIKDDSQFGSPTFVGARWPLAGHYFSSKTLQRHMCVSLSTLDIHLFLSHSHVLYLGLTWSARGPISELGLWCHFLQDKAPMSFFVIFVWLRDLSFFLGLINKYINCSSLLSDCLARAFLAIAHRFCVVWYCFLFPYLP